MSDDWKPLPPDSFVSKLSFGPAPDPLILNVDLERRLLEAQQEGLEANVRRQHKFLGSPSLIELQILGVRKGNSVYESSFAAHALSVDDAVRLTSEVDRWSAHGIYILCAQLKPGVETRQSAPGKWFEVPKSSGTKDTDVDVRLILSIDFDVHRPTSISTTNEELERSIRTSLSGWSYLSGSIGSEYCLAYVHSGNGRQIHIALDMLPNDDEVKNLCAGILVGMGSLFDSDTIKVDQKLFDAKRILPACGTVKKKGASGIPERPHRRTAIVLGSPEPSDADESAGAGVIRRLSLDDLKALARQIWNDTDDEGRASMSKAMGIKPAAPPQTVSQLTPSSDSPFARANSVAPGDVAMWLGVYDGTTPVCPGCGESKGVAVLNHGFKCSHNRCQSRGRNGFRTNVDLVAEVRGVAPRDAVNALAEKFGFEGLGAAPVASFSPISTEKKRRLTSHNTFDYWLEEGPLVHEPISFGVIDELTGGGPVYGSRWYILGAPDACKTAFAVQTAHVLAQRGIVVGILAVDEEPSDIQTRLVQRIGFSRKDAEIRDPTKIAHMRSVMEQFAPIYFFEADDTVESASEELHRAANGGKAVLIVDSVQTVSCAAILALKEEPSEYQRVTRNVQAIRSCTTRYRLITFATSEMNREAYKEINKNDPKPKKQKSHMASGKQSGAIEYSARVMLSFENAMSQDEVLPDTFKVGIEKNKHGPRGNFFYVGIDRTRMTLAHVPGPDAQADEMAAAEERRRQKVATEAEKLRMREAAKELKEASERSARMQREAADDAACLLLVTERAGIGAHELRGLMAAKLGGCERKRVEESVARLMLRNLVRVEQDGPRKPARHFPSTGMTAPSVQDTDPQ